MKYAEKCDHCGQQLTAYTHTLGKPLVNALRKLVDFYQDNKTPANLQNDIVLTKNQYNNFQKLQYFELVRRSDNGWYPTQLGIDFINGNGFILSPVATMGKNILESSHPAWKTHQAPRYKIGVLDIDGTQYKKREEYQEEKSNQQKMI